jgi:hypothetical protein
MSVPNLLVYLVPIQLWTTWRGGVKHGVCLGWCGSAGVRVFGTRFGLTVQALIRFKECTAVNMHLLCVKVVDCCNNLPCHNLLCCAASCCTAVLWHAVTCCAVHLQQLAPVLHINVKRHALSNLSRGGGMFWTVRSMEAHMHGASCHLCMTSYSNGMVQW